MKGIEFIGGEILTIPGVFGPSEFGKESVTINMATLEDLYSQNQDQISAIISNSCFFSPRVPDPIKDIAKFAQNHNLIHIINNAYGLQSPMLSHIIRQAIDAGRVDAIVQSTDKCFLTPVGGSLITSPISALLEQISQAYAGRASAMPVVQLLISLLSLGKQGYIDAIAQQQHCRSKLENFLCQLAPQIQEHVLDNTNPVSCALSLTHYSPTQVAKLGGFLYNLRVTGPRVINTYESAFGTCCPLGGIPWPYIVMNAAIGVQESHISEAIKRLEKALHQL
jgi:O-phospho-L-seryl-tRNASec:L-selenocysteinyl-tRNA synthase